MDIDKGVIESGVAYIKGKSNRIAFWEFISGILNLTMQNLMTVYLTWQVYRGSLSIGDYAALLNGTFTMMFQLQGLVGIIPAFYEHSLYIGNLRKILDAPCKIEKDTGLTIPSDRPLTIEFDHVSFCYPFSEKLVLDDVCLCFTAGTKTAIVGHNGAGKTTTMPVSDFLLSRPYKQTEDEARVASVLEHVGLTANMRRCITHSRKVFAKLLSKGFSARRFKSNSRLLMFNNLPLAQIIFTEIANSVYCNYRQLQRL